MEGIRTLTAIAPPYPDGQKLDTVIIEYERDVDSGMAGGPCVDAYAVAGRTIKSVYTNADAGRTEVPCAGRFCILELNVCEPAADIMQLEELVFDEPGPHFHEDGSPVLPQAYRRAVAEHVIQTRSVSAADGSVIAPWEQDTQQAVQPLIDDFSQGHFEDIPFNLYEPRIQAGERYPLVVFLHDAGPNGSDPYLTLSQGNGPTSFASAEDQKKHPCFILAPQIPKEVHLTTDKNTCAPQLETLKALIDLIVAAHPVDPDRIYWTGQSQGSMAGFEINIRYPDFFAASLLAAGQWDAARVGEACAGGTFWMLASDGDLKACPGMDAITAALKENGAKAARYHWNAKWTPQALDQAAREAASDDVNVRFTIFDDHSVIPDGGDDNPGANHMATWPVVYGIGALRDWLFTQKRR